MSQVCYDCASPIEAGRVVCPHCGGISITRGRARPRVAGVSASAALPFPWSVLGRWELGGCVALAGPPGSGKSTLAACLDVSLWLTCEQTAGQAAALLRRVTPDEMPEIVVVAPGASERIGRELDQLGAGLVVLDSLTAASSLDGQLEVLDRMIAWCRGGARQVLVILGVNADDSPAGRRQLRHRVDVSAVVRAGEDGLRVLEVEKNRYGPLSSAYFTLGAGGAGRPEFRYSYSIEGRPGAYRLEPYPSSHARWDGLLRARFGEAPEPGWASAARMVPSYPDGRIEPADVGERRRFAADHGLQWLE